jgi:3-hydroxyacyl-CoA dehydrogenase
MKMRSPEPVEVAVIGTGLMGASLAQAFAQNGLGVSLIGRRQESLDRARSVIRFEVEEAVAKGIFSAPQAEEIKQCIHGGMNLEAVCKGDDLRLVIESVSENIGLKKELFSWLDEFCPQHVVLATNTSCLDAELLAAQTRRPDRVVWLHFFFPAHKNHAAEYSPLSRSSEKSLETVAVYLSRMRKTAVRLLQYRKGGVANIIFVGLILEAVRMLDEGYGTAGVEAAGTAAFGMPTRFVRLLQSVGFDLAASCLESFSDTSSHGHPLACAYANFFSPPFPLRQKFDEARDSGQLISIEQLLTPERTARPGDEMVIEGLKRRFLAVAFMTASEVVDAGLITPGDADRLCQVAFSWPRGPFALMNGIGVGTALQLVTERMVHSHRQEINFPIPRVLILQSQKNEPWPL